MRFYGCSDTIIFFLNGNRWKLKLPVCLLVLSKNDGFLANSVLLTHRNRRESKKRTEFQKKGVSKELIER